MKWRPSASVLDQAGGQFRIFFWGLHSDTRKKLVVGYYDSATLTSKGDLKTVDRYFEKARIYDRRIKELAAVPGITEVRARKEVKDIVRKGSLRFKCAVKDVHVLNTYFPIGDKVNGKHVSSYFTNPTILDGALTVSDIARGIGSAKALPAGRKAPLAEDGYLRESPARLKIIIPRHNKLSNDFVKWLKTEGFQAVTQEAGYVDIEFRDGSTLCRAELKTCYGMTSTKAIREALGQLLEYNYYGDCEKASSWMVVLDRAPSDHDMTFVSALAQIPLPISLAWPSADGFELRRFV